jgi:hypothetical protein
VAAIFIEFDIAQYDDVLASFFDSDKSEQCAFSILLLLKISAFPSALKKE